MDLQNVKWMYAKAAMFLLIGTCCLGSVCMENPTLHTAILLLIMIWAFARAYYFAFYVIEKYVDSKYRFSGIFSFIVWCTLRNRRSAAARTEKKMPEE